MNSTIDIEEAAKKTAEDLLEKISSARAVVIATEDGFQVAFAAREKLDVSRLSAITSSMSAISQVVTLETNLGEVRCLMIEAEDGYLVLRSTCRRGVGLVIAALSGREALLGMVIHGVGEAARSLAQ